MEETHFMLASLLKLFDDILGMEKLFDCMRGRRAEHGGIENIRGAGS